QAGSAIERRNLLRGRALNRLKGGRATIALPVASCNHQVITVAGSHRSERDLLDCRGLIHDSLPAEAARVERDGSVLALEDRRLESVHVLHPVGHTHSRGHDGPLGLVDATVVAYGRDRHAQRLPVLVDNLRNSPMIRFSVSSSVVSSSSGFVN